MNCPCGIHKDQCTYHKDPVVEDEENEDTKWSCPDAISHVFIFIKD
jgi:hypothetical protein